MPCGTRDRNRGKYRGDEEGGRRVTVTTPFVESHRAQNTRASWAGTKLSYERDENTTLPSDSGASSTVLATVQRRGYGGIYGLVSLSNSLKTAFCDGIFPLSATHFNSDVANKHAFPTDSYTSPFFLQVRKPSLLPGLLDEVERASRGRQQKVCSGFARRKRDMLSWECEA